MASNILDAFVLSVSNFEHFSIRTLTVNSVQYSSVNSQVNSFAGKNGPLDAFAATKISEFRLQISDLSDLSDWLQRDVANGGLSDVDKCSSTAVVRLLPFDYCSLTTANGS